jgi:hypothetical protein
MAPGLDGQAGAAGAISAVIKHCGIGATWAGESHAFLCCVIFDMAAKRRKNHKNKISGLVTSMCYNEQKSKF